MPATITITADTLDEANDRMAAAVRRGADDDELRDVWQPIAQALIDAPIPEGREAEAEDLSTDYVGALDTGELVAWGEDIATGRGWSWRPFVLIP